MTYTSLIFTVILATFPITVSAVDLKTWEAGHRDLKQRLDYELTREEREDVKQLFRDMNDRCKNSKEANCYEKQLMQKAPAASTDDEAAAPAAEKERMMEEEQQDEEQY